MRQIYAAITLVHAALFIPPLAYGFLLAFINYEPYIPEMFQITTLGASFVFTLLQAVVAILFLLLRQSRTTNVLQGMALGSIIAACLGIGTIVLFHDDLPVPGSTSFVWVVIVAGIWPVVLRITLKEPYEIAPDEGGEKVAPSLVVPLLLVVIASLVSCGTVYLANQTEVMTTDDSSSVSPEFINADEVNISPKETSIAPPLHSTQMLENFQKSSNKPAPPGLYELFSLAGSWKIEADGESDSSHTASAWALQNEPWILWLIQDSTGTTIETELTGYNESRGRYEHYTASYGHPASFYVGEWIPEQRMFRWQMKLSDGTVSEMLEMITPNSLVNRATIWRVEEVVHESMMTLKRMAAPTDKEFLRHEFLNRLVGHWNLKIELEDRGQPLVKRAGQLIVTPVVGESANVERFFDENGNFRTFRVMTGDSEQQLFVLQITELGDLIASEGNWDKDAETMTWRPAVEHTNDEVSVDRFEKPDRIVSTSVREGFRGKVVAVMIAPTFPNRRQHNAK